MSFRFARYASWVFSTACLLCMLPAQAAPPLATPINPPVFAPWGGDIQHTAWTSKDGAPSSVYSMSQDGNGLLWFAARDGLYSFDGTRFVRTDRVYGHALQSPVTVAVAAFDETVWVAYQFGGISRFERESVRHYLPGKDGPQGSSHLLVRMPDGTMWTNGSGGLWKLENDRWRLVRPDEGLPTGGFPHITLYKDGSILISSSDGLYQSMPTGRPGEYRFRQVLGPPRLVGGALRPDGRILIRTLDEQMSMLDVATGKREPFKLDIGSAPNLGYLSDSRGGLWVSTGDAIQLLDGSGKPLHKFVTASGFSAGSFTNVMSDREGNVWIATPNGVDRVRPARLSNLALPPRLAGKLSVTPGDRGEVWVSDAFQPGPFDAPTFVHQPDGQRRTTAMRAVSSGHRQTDGTLWFAGEARLWRVKDGITRHWPLPPGAKGADVQAMSEGRDGRLWLSIIRKGIYSFREGVWEAGGGDPELARHAAIFLATDRRGRVWFGYPGDRVAVLDGKRLTRYGHEHGLDVGNTLSIAAGRDRIWFGGDRGLAWFDGRRFIAVKEHGGGFRGVSGIVERANGELWLHDTGGLARIDPAELRATDDGAAHVVHAERFNHLDGHRGTPAQISPLPTLVEATDGRLWYVTSSSVGHLDPVAIPRNPRPPTVLVGAVRTDQQHYLPRPGLVLPAGTERVEFDFTATALSIPERVRFRYRLLNQDRDWRDAGGLRQAVYTNLAPGPYTFEVHAANEDGVWSPQPARAAFRIEPAFTQTHWFKLACVLAVALAAWLLHRWRLKRVEAHLLEKVKVRLLERQRIARTLHDTFLQSVQALVLRMHVLMGKLPDDSAMRAEVGGVLAQAEAVIEEGRERVRQLRVPGVRHGCLLQALGDAGRELAAASGVAFVQEVTGAARELDPEVEDELFTIGREALSNAFHHAGASRVTLALDYSAERLRLEVRDDGRGIAPEILARGAREGHWGLPGMRERARLAGGDLDIDSTPVGTVVSVCIPVTTAYQGMRRA